MTASWHAVFHSAESAPPARQLHPLASASPASSSNSGCSHLESAKLQHEPVVFGCPELPDRRARGSGSCSAPIVSLKLGNPRPRSSWPDPPLSAQTRSLATPSCSKAWKPRHHHRAKPLARCGDKGHAFGESPPHAGQFLRQSRAVTSSSSMVSKGRDRSRQHGEQGHAAKLLIRHLGDVERSGLDEACHTRTDCVRQRRWR